MTLNCEFETGAGVLVISAAALVPSSVWYNRPRSGICVTALVSASASGSPPPRVTAIPGMPPERLMRLKASRPLVQTGVDGLAPDGIGAPRRPGWLLPERSAVVV